MKQRVAVIFGGQSSEHSISCLSAAGVLEAIDRDQFDVVAVGVGQDGRWFQVSDQSADWQRAGEKLPEVPATGTEVRLVSANRVPLPGSQNSAADASESGALGEIAVDVAFPVLHGMFGEDGTIQGALEVAGIPYVGSGVLASAAGMDKQATKVFLEAAGLPVGSYAVFNRAEWDSDNSAVVTRVEALELPVFVKPARAGSSVGITKLKDHSELAAAVQLALEHDDKVIVEQSIEAAREVECAVLQAANGIGATATRCAEIVVGSNHEFYDYDAKYINNDVELVVPAALDSRLHDQLGEIAIRAFHALGARGLARVDFFVRPDGTFVINEVNTMPGFTAVSLYPRMTADSGISFAELVDRLLQLALKPTLGPR